MNRPRGMPGSGIWTVARQTFVQCLRTGVIAVFTVLIIASLALLPALLKGDGTVAGRIRTFLDYSTTAVSLLTGLAVVLLSAGLINGDVAGRQILILCTKPLSRWKYVLGRWLGVVMLATLLVAGSYVAIYFTATHLRKGALNPDVRPEDARAVELEVFAARTKTPAPDPNVNGLVLAEIEKMKAQGKLESAVRGYMDSYHIDQPEAIAKLEEQLRREALSSAQSAAPEGSNSGKSYLEWNFTNLPYSGEAWQAPGQISRIDPTTRVVSFWTYPDMTRRLVVFGPVWIGRPDDKVAMGPAGAVGRVIGIAPGQFGAQFQPDVFKARFASADPNAMVSIVAQPTLQLSYKVTAVGQDSGMYRKIGWVFENPDANDHFAYIAPPQDVKINQQTTVIVPAAAVDKQGRMTARFFNLSPTSVTVLSSDVSVLYGLGGFEMNLVRSAILVVLGLMFVTAMGTFASSWMSFGVSCLWCFVLLGYCTMMGFLGRAVAMGADAGDKTGAAWYAVAGGVQQVMGFLLPDLSSTMLTDFIVDGRLVTWHYVGWAALLGVGVRAAILLALGCLIFQRRELARVQV